MSYHREQDIRLLVHSKIISAMSLKDISFLNGYFTCKIHSSEEGKVGFLGNKIIQSVHLYEQHVFQSIN